MSDEGTYVDLNGQTYDVLGPRGLLVSFNTGRVHDSLCPLPDPCLVRS